MSRAACRIEKLGGVGPRSAATYGDYDFQLVAIHCLRIAVLAARHDFPVFFDGDAFANEVEFDHQFGNRKWGWKLA